MEEEEYEDDEAGATKSTTRTRETSPAPPIVYRYQLRPTSSGRRSNAAAAGPGSDAGSVALSDKYKRLGRSPRPRSEDQVGEM